MWLHGLQSVGVGIGKGGTTHRRKGTKAARSILKGKPQRPQRFPLAILFHFPPAAPQGRLLVSQLTLAIRLGIIPSY